MSLVPRHGTHLGNRQGLAPPHGEKTLVKPLYPSILLKQDLNAPEEAELGTKHEHGDGADEPSNDEVGGVCLVSLLEELQFRIWGCRFKVCWARGFVSALVDLESSAQGVHPVPGDGGKE